MFISYQNTLVCPNKQSLFSSISPLESSVVSVLRTYGQCVSGISIPAPHQHFDFGDKEEDFFKLIYLTLSCTCYGRAESHGVWVMKAEIQPQGSQGPDALAWRQETRV